MTKCVIAVSYTFFDRWGSSLILPLLPYVLVWQHMAAWIVVLLTIDRFVAVWFPLKATTWCTVTRAGIASAVCTALVVIYRYRDRTGADRAKDELPPSLLYLSPPLPYPPLLSLSLFSFTPPLPFPAPPLHKLVAWHSGRTPVSGRRTFPVLRSTCS